jgi:phosphatidate cytidylyltransferase
MSLIRIIVGIILAIVASLCFYYQYINLLYALVNLAAAYDAYYMYAKLHLKPSHVFLFMLSISSLQYYLLHLYFVKPLAVIKIIAITQTSDIYQYFAGSRCGINKIGWISSNKSYEGYYFGFIATLLTFIPIYQVLSLYLIIPTTFYQATYEIFMIFWLGVASGLLSSLFKRLQGIKDYSDMLGPHGGWLDRIDSIIFPSLFAFLM